MSGYYCLQDFVEARCLGRGEFGTVYEAHLATDPMAATSVTDDEEEEVEVEAESERVGYDLHRGQSRRRSKNRNKNRNKNKNNATSVVVVDTQETFAMKCELLACPTPQLQHEFAVYRALRREVGDVCPRLGVPQVYCYDEVEDQRKMVMELFGISLFHLFRTRYVAGTGIRSGMGLGTSDGNDNKSNNDNNNNTTGMPLLVMCKIALDMLDALRYIHHKRWLHNDLKPENIVILSEKRLRGEMRLAAAAASSSLSAWSSRPGLRLGQPQVLHLVDFGFAQTYMHQEQVQEQEQQQHRSSFGNDEDRDPREGADVSGCSSRSSHAFRALPCKQTNGGFRGTVHYASINTHLGVTPAPRDDLESLGYILVFLATGKLPWSSQRTNRASVERVERAGSLRGSVSKRNAHFRACLKLQPVRQLKIMTPVHQLCAGLPPEFATYFQRVLNLRYDDTPPYQEFVLLFESLAQQLLAQGHILAPDWMYVKSPPPPTSTPAPPRTHGYGIPSSSSTLPGRSGTSTDTMSRNNNGRDSMSAAAASASAAFLRPPTQHDSMDQPTAYDRASRSLLREEEEEDDEAYSDGDGEGEDAEHLEEPEDDATTVVTRGHGYAKRPTSHQHMSYREGDEPRGFVSDEEEEEDQEAEDDEDGDEGDDGDQGEQGHDEEVQDNLHSVVQSPNTTATTAIAGAERSARWSFVQEVDEDEGAEEATEAAGGGAAGATARTQCLPCVTSPETERREFGQQGEGKKEEEKSNMRQPYYSGGLLDSCDVDDEGGVGAAPPRSPSPPSSASTFAAGAGQGHAPIVANVVVVARRAPIVFSRRRP